mgnify:CR=1 FL=1
MLEDLGLGDIYDIHNLYGEFIGSIVLLTKLQSN